MTFEYLNSKKRKEINDVLVRSHAKQACLG